MLRISPVPWLSLTSPPAISISTRVFEAGMTGISPFTLNYSFISPLFSLRIALNPLLKWTPPLPPVFTTVLLDVIWARSIFSSIRRPLNLFMASWSLVSCAENSVSAGETCCTASFAVYSDAAGTSSECQDVYECALSSVERNSLGGSFLTAFGIVRMHHFWWENSSK